MYSRNDPATHDPRPVGYDPRMGPYAQPQHRPYHGHPAPGKPLPNQTDNGQNYFHESPVGVHHSQRYPEYGPDYYNRYDQNHYNLGPHPSYQVPYAPTYPPNPHAPNRDPYNQNIYKSNPYAPPGMDRRDPYLTHNAPPGYHNLGTGNLEAPYGRYVPGLHGPEPRIPQGEKGSTQGIVASAPPQGEEDLSSNKSAQGGSGQAGKSSTSSEGRDSSRSRGKQQNRRLDAKKFSLSMELIDHAAHGRVEEVTEKIKQGASLECTDYDQRTPLHAAAAEGHLEVVKLLLQEGANPDVTDRWGRRPIDEAVRKGFKEISDELLKHGKADEHTLHKEHHDGLELLQHCANGALELVRSKIRAGASINFTDYDLRTPLHLVCCEGHEDVADFLLHNGADPLSVDRFGHTPVEDAILNGHEGVLQLIKSSGIQVPAYIFNKRFTQEFQRNLQLIDSCAKGKVGAVQKLIRDGADVHFSDYDKRTALHLAACEGHLKVAKLLLAAGADPTTEDRCGRSAHDEAVTYNHKEIVTTMDSHMENTVRKSG